MLIKTIAFAYILKKIKLPTGHTYFQDIRLLPVVQGLTLRRG